MNDRSYIRGSAGVLWERLVTSMRARGIGGTLRHAINWCARRFSARGRQERRFDAEYGVNTAGRIRKYDLPTDSPNLVYSAEYNPTPVADFVNLLAGLHIDFHDWVFVDLGAGKGRALLLASRFPFKKIIGVEFVPELARIAGGNAEKLRASIDPRADITVVCCDVCEYRLPLEKTVIYLNNPFSGPVMDIVVSNIEQSLAACPRELVVVYWNPFASVALDRSGMLKKTGESVDYATYCWNSGPSRVPAGAVDTRDRE